MGCSSSINNMEHSNLVKLLIKCTQDIITLIKNYNSLYSILNNISGQDIIKSIIIDKKNHINTLNSMYKLATGENIILNLNEFACDSYEKESLINEIINKELTLTSSLKNLRFSIPVQNIKYEVNNILIDVNTSVNKLLLLIIKADDN
ncbi:MAG: hypothetical protein RR645_02505 [Clostridium sp.]